MQVLKEYIFVHKSGTALYLAGKLPDPGGRQLFLTDIVL